MRRDERERRIDADDGDPDDTVFCLPSNRGSGGRCYHDDPDCRRLQQSLDDDEQLLDPPRAEAQHRSWPPCRCCILTDELADQEPNYEIGGLLQKMRPDEFDKLVAGEIEEEELKARVRERAEGGSVP